MPKLSIIIPTLNEEKRLDAAIKSIKKQDFKDYEIIISDSGSKDNTLEIAQKHGAKIILGPKKGPGAGKNLGASHANGDVLFFMDADSALVSDDTLGVLMKTMENPKYGSGFFKGTGYGQKSIIYTLFNIINNVFVIFNRPMTPGYCMFIDRKVFEQLKGFNEEIEICEDFDLSWRMIKITGKKAAYIRKRKVFTSTRRFEFGKVKELLHYLNAFKHLMLKKEVPKTKFKFKPGSELENSKESF